MSDEKPKPQKIVWRRPELPEAHQGAGIGLGNFLAVAGVAVLILGPLISLDAYGTGGAAALMALLLPIGGALLGMGAVITAVSMILREIRRGAFEAALRAGETEAS